MFVGFAVAVILKHIFSQESIRTDAVIGALCGYLLAAVTWANAYALLYLLRPGSFRVADVIAGRLVDWHLRRFYFNYFSVTTLTSLGYADITPTDTVALSLSLVEGLFGQFYIAVVVAQLVGLRLAQSIGGTVGIDGESRRYGNEDKSDLVISRMAPVLAQVDDESEDAVSIPYWTKVQ